jgi:hypothetical protein
MIASPHGGDAGHWQGNGSQHVGIDPQIDAGCFQAAMSKQIADRFDANAASKQVLWQLCGAELIG